jgi:phthalate 4,5-dioxygenase oxygenase subunit
MFSAEENELLTRTCPGTLMGTLFRRYWLPFMLAAELPEADLPPKRVTLLGEDLVVFRDSQRRIGLLDRHCPHRRADLFFARNEDCGLRCTYHGWKFETTGQCVDMPAEPANSNYKERIRIKAYPTREAGGVIWAYLGDPKVEPAELPELEWTQVPIDRVFVSKRLQHSNYAQAIEGGLDSSHVSFLHRTFTEVQTQTTGQDGFLVQRPLYMVKDTRPRFFVNDTNYGFTIGARRDATQSEYYWRISQFLMPCFTIIPSAVGRPLTGHCWTPIDDYNCWAFTISWHPDRALTDLELHEYREGEQIHARVDQKFLTAANKSNDYLIDRQMQRKVNFTGIVGVGVQDMSVQEGMGPITDRTKEHLGLSDTAIVHWRRMMLQEAKKLSADAAAVPRGVSNEKAYRVRGGAALVAKDKNVFEELGASLMGTN